MTAIRRRYVANIFFAKPADYVKATQSVFRSGDRASAVWLPVAGARAVKDQSAKTGVHTGSSQGLKRTHAEAGEILCVSCHQRQVVLDGRGRDHSVGYSERPTRRLAFGIEYAPSLGDALGHWKNPLTEP